MTGMPGCWPAAPSAASCCRRPRRGWRPRRSPRHSTGPRPAPGCSRGCPSSVIRRCCSAWAPAGDDRAGRQRPTPGRRRPAVRAGGLTRPVSPGGARRAPSGRQLVLVGGDRRPPGRRAARAAASRAASRSRSRSALLRPRRLALGLPVGRARRTATRHSADRSWAADRAGRRPRRARCHLRPVLGDAGQETRSRPCRSGPAGQRRPERLRRGPDGVGQGDRPSSPPTRYATALSRARVRCRRWGRHPPAARDRARRQQHPDLPGAVQQHRAQQQAPARISAACTTKEAFISSCAAESPARVADDVVRAGDSPP